MGNKGLITLLLVFIVGACKIQSQVPTIIPKQVVATTTNQIQIWNGSAFVLKELVGFTSSSTQMTIPSVVDGSITNEGQLSISGNTLVDSVTLTSNTSGSTAIKMRGADGNYIHKSTTNDTLFIGNVATESTLLNHTSVTVNNTTMTAVGNTTIEQEEGLNTEFTIYLHYTTGGTGQGLQFRIISVGAGTGTYWYDYNFPITGSRVTGAIYNANTTITIPSSESGTNIAVIRGVTKSAGLFLGIFAIQLQVSAEDGASTITTLTTGITQF